MNTQKEKIVDQLKVKWPKHSHAFQYEPSVSCALCKGSGINPERTLSSGTRMKETPCACVFFGSETSKIVGQLKSASRLLLL